MTDTKKRCSWCLGNELYIQYHDTEWGTPEHRDTRLFEFLTLEGAQAGLSWLTILKRRAMYREAFANFDITTVSQFSEQDYEALLQNAGIIRNRLKISSTISNAQQALLLSEEFGSLDSYFWSYCDFEQINHKITSVNALPAFDELATKMSKDLLKRGLRFVGPTICYSFMQATGIVNDHTEDCFRYKELTA